MDCHSNSPILFLGLYDRGECRIFSFWIGLEDNCLLRIYIDFGNYNGDGNNKDFGDVITTKEVSTDYSSQLKLYII